MTSVSTSIAHPVSYRAVPWHPHLEGPYPLNVVFLDPNSLFFSSFPWCWYRNNSSSSFKMPCSFVLSLSLNFVQPYSWYTKLTWFKNRESGPCHRKICMPYLESKKMLRGKSNQCPLHNTGNIVLWLFSICLLEMVLNILIVLINSKEIVP